MVHEFKNNGYDIVLDVNSGAIHVVDDVTYDVIGMYEEHTRDEILRELSERYPQTEVEEAIDEVQQLKENGELFTEDVYESHITDFKKRPTVVKALCLHIAHDCNLACQYCFAEEGEYHGRRALMSYETGKQALDFLIANSGNRRNLEVDFFGGEPLLNFDVVKQLVAYDREQEKLHDKHFRFTLTTNGVLLNDDIMEFANREMDNVVLSIDGRKEVHDRMRPFRNGTGSYDLIVPKFQKFAESRNQDKYYEHFLGNYTSPNSVAWTTFKSAGNYNTAYCLENCMLQQAQKNGYSTGIFFDARIEPNNNVYKLNDANELVLITDKTKYPDPIYYYNYNFYDSPNAVKKAAGISSTSATDEDIYTKKFKKSDDGYHCYYVYWIRHEDNHDNYKMDVMEFAIVRNNYYKMHVTDIAGLGDTDIPIVPDKPDEGETYLKVELKVRSWIVRNIPITF